MEHQPKPHPKDQSAPKKRMGVATNLWIAMVAAGFIAGIGFLLGPSTVLPELLGMSEEQAAQSATMINAGLVFVMAFLAGFGPKAWRIVAQAMCGGVFGLHVGAALAGEADQAAFAFAPDAVFAILVGIFLLIIGLMLGAGLINTKIAVAMELENSDVDRAVLRPSAMSCVCEGALLIVLAVMSVLPPTHSGLWIAGLLGIGLLLTSAGCHRAAWVNTDELFRRYWMESIALGSAAFVLIIMVWMLAQFAGLVPAASLLGAVALYYVTYLTAAIWLMNTRYPWMMKKQSEQDAEVAL